MNRNGHTQQDTWMLRRIVALLFSLAAAAEQFAYMSAPVRIPAMALLWRAEALAHAYVYWKARKCGAPLQWGLPDECRASSDPEDALALGWWFRVLAVALRDLPRRALSVNKTRNGWRKAACSACRRTGLAMAAPAAPDTS